MYDGHIGINKCQEIAKEQVWLPRHSSQIKKMVACCSNYIRTRHYNIEPFIPSITPSLLIEKK